MSDSPITYPFLTNQQKIAAIGALVGSAVGDALGAPFEFKAPGLYRDTFPARVLDGHAEMIGGGAFNWKIAEATDDTQMAIALAESLICADGFDAEATWEHFIAWKSGATDIGITSREVLSRRDFRTAAREAHDLLGRTASNGSVMRIAPIGIAGVTWGTKKTVEIAFAQSSLTHFDPAAGWGAVIVAELIRRLIIGTNFDTALGSICDLLPDPHKSNYDQLLSNAWSPSKPDPRTNSSVWICVAQAVWAVRTTNSFEEAIVAAVNLGDDADTVGAVTGAIAGARYGIQQIPSRWSTNLNCTLNLTASRETYRLGDFHDLARQLLGGIPRQETPPEPAAGPTLIADEALHAANLMGATAAFPETAVISLCRTYDRFADRLHHREYYIRDEQGDENPNLYNCVHDAVEAIDAFMRSGRDVVVHCHGGRSRTGLILKAWYMKNQKASHTQAHDWLQDKWPLYATYNRRFWDFLDYEWQVT